MCTPYYLIGIYLPPFLNWNLRLVRQEIYVVPPFRIERNPLGFQASMRLCVPATP